MDSTDWGVAEADEGGNGNSGVTDRGKVSHSGDDKLDNDLNSSEGGGDIELQEDGLGNDLTPSEGGGDTITGDVDGTGYRRDREAILLSGSVYSVSSGCIIVFGAWHPGLKSWDGL